VSPESQAGSRCARLRWQHDLSGDRRAFEQFMSTRSFFQREALRHLWAQFLLRQQLHQSTAQFY
jgi:hypothetical protein